MDRYNHEKGNCEVRKERSPSTVLFHALLPQRLLSGLAGRKGNCGGAYRGDGGGDRGGPMC